MWRDKLLSLDWWKTRLALLAVLGIVLIILGRMIAVRTVVYVGMGLVAPLVVGGGLALVLGVPFLLLAGKRDKNDGR